MQRLKNMGVNVSDDVGSRQTPVSVGRRDFLRRGAIVGGLVWTAPLVHSFAAPALATAGTDKPAPEPVDDFARYGVSFMALVFYDGSEVLHRAKFEAGPWAWVEPGKTQGAAACLPGRWETQGIKKVQDDGGGTLEERFGLRVQKVKDEQWLLFVPSALKILDEGSGALLIGVKSGGGNEGCGEVRVDSDNTLGGSGTTLIILGGRKPEDAEKERAQDESENVDEPEEGQSAEDDKPKKAEPKAEEVKVEEGKTEEADAKDAEQDATSGSLAEAEGSSDSAESKHSEDEISG